MAVVVDAEAIAPVDRAEAIRQLIWDRVVRVEISQQPDPATIRVRGRIADVGAVNVCSVRANATTVERTPALAAGADDPYIFIGLQLSGSSMVIQNEREALLRPGDIALYDTRKPYTLVNHHGIHQHFFRIRPLDLAVPARVLDALTARTFDASAPLAAVTSSHLSRLAETVARMTPWEADRVTEPTLALVRALLASMAGADAQAREALDRSLEVRVMQYLRSHLADPQLSAAAIAAAHHISVRHLYRVLDGVGVSLGAWIRDQRLSGVRRDLSEPYSDDTVSAIAHRWGFTDLTHFGRAFKSATGLTPGQWRQSHRATD